MSDWQVEHRTDGDLDLFLDLDETGQNRIEVVAYLKFSDTTTDLWVSAPDENEYSYGVYFRMNDYPVFQWTSSEDDPEEHYTDTIDTIKQVAVQKVGYFLRNTFTNYFNQVSGLGGEDFWYELTF